MSPWSEYDCRFPLSVEQPLEIKRSTTSGLYGARSRRACVQGEAEHGAPTVSPHYIGGCGGVCTMSPTSVISAGIAMDFHLAMKLDGFGSIDISQA
jgi:hypothetical protein